jgi:hypothetical protein
MDAKRARSLLSCHEGVNTPAAQPSDQRGQDVWRQLVAVFVKPAAISESSVAIALAIMTGACTGRGPHIALRLERSARKLRFDSTLCARRQFLDELD